MEGICRPSNKVLSYHLDIFIAVYCSSIAQIHGHAIEFFSVKYVSRHIKITSLAERMFRSEGL